MTEASLRRIKKKIESEKTQPPEDSVSVDQIQLDVKNSTRSYFQRKKNLNEANKYRIESELRENEQNRKWERRKAEAVELQEVAKAEKLAQERKKYDVEVKDYAKKRDYLDVLREARAVEYRELNKAYDDKEKLRQSNLTEKIREEKEEIHKEQEDRESEWKRLDLERKDYYTENKKWREENYQRELSRIKTDKERITKREEEEQKKQKDLLEWAIIEEERVQPKYNYLPRAVEDVLISNLLQTDIDEDDEYEYRDTYYNSTTGQKTYPRAEAAERYRPRIPIVPDSESHLLKKSTREVDRQIEEARRVVTDAVLYRAKSHRRTYFKE